MCVYLCICVCIYIYIINIHSTLSVELSRPPYIHISCKQNFYFGCDQSFDSISIVCSHTKPDTYSTVRVSPGPCGLGRCVQFIGGKLQNTSKTLMLSNGGKPLCSVMQRKLDTVSPHDSPIVSNSGTDVVHSWQHWDSSSVGNGWHFPHVHHHVSFERGLSEACVSSLCLSSSSVYSGSKR